MRLDLPNGQWAELRDRLSYEQARDVRRAFMESQLDPVKLADLDIALVRAYVRGWAVMDLDGNALDLGQPEQAPDELITKIARAALEVWNVKDDPKGESSEIETSPTSLKALA